MNESWSALLYHSPHLLLFTNHTSEISFSHHLARMSFLSSCEFLSSFLLSFMLVFSINFCLGSFCSECWFSLRRMGFPWICSLGLFNFEKLTTFFLVFLPTLNNPFSVLGIFGILLLWCLLLSWNHRSPLYILIYALLVISISNWPVYFRFCWPFWRFRT